MPSENIRVLIVEDNDADVELIQRNLLTKNGLTYEMVRANRLSEALSVIASAPSVDVVILDLGLPDSVGRHTFDAVFSVVGEAVPVIVITSTDDEELAIECVALGAQEFVVKSRLGIEAPISQIIRQAKVRHARLLDRLQGEDTVTTRIAGAEDFLTRVKKRGEAADRCLAKLDSGLRVLKQHSEG